MHERQDLGPAGVVAGAGVGGAATELARQGIGEAFGLEDNVNLGQAALVGSVSAALPAAAGLARGAARRVGNLAAEGIGRVTGIQAPVGMSMRQTLKEHAKFIGQTEFRTPAEALAGIRARLHKINTHKLLEKVEYTWHQPVSVSFGLLNVCQIPSPTMP